MSADADRAKPRGGRGLHLLMRTAGTLHRGLYRLTGGRLGASLGAMPVLLLTTTGRKSGQPRTWPLAYFRDGDRLVIIASAGGQPEHPAWYHNLRANPRVTIQLGQEQRIMIADAAAGEERERLWTRVVGEAPNFADYQTKTTRQIPVVILTAAADA